MNDSTRKSAAIRTAYIALGLIAALVVTASFLPHVRLWGINHLSFHAPSVRLISLAIIVLSFVPAINQRAYSGLGKAHRLVRAGRRGIVIAVFCSAAAFVLFLGFGSSTVLLGDGVYVLNNTTVAAEAELTPKEYITTVTFGEDAWSFVRKGRRAATVNPGADLLNFLSSYLVRTVFESDVLAGVRALSAIVGVLLVGALFVFVRRANGPSVWPMCVALLALGSGAVQLFFGYVENYAPSLLVGIIYVLTAYRVLFEKGSIWYPLILLVLAVVLHAQSLVLAPSMVFLILWVSWIRKRPTYAGAAWKAIVALTVAGAVVAATTGAAGNHYLRLLGGPYSVFSIQHLLDIVNELLLLLPAGLILYVLGAASPPAPKDNDGGDRSAAAFAWCLLAPCSMFLLLFRPDLGMARDWDLFAFTVLGFAIPAALGLKRFLRAEGLRRHHARIVIPSLTLSLVITFAWITVNADANRSVKRFKAVLDYDKNGQSYAFETLAKHFEIRGERQSQLEALREAYNTSRNPRYKVRIARLQGDTELTLEGLREMLALNPANDLARVQLLQILMTRGDPNEVIDVATSGIHHSPDVPYYPYCVGRALIAQGKLREGIQYFERCQQLDAPPQLLREIDMVLEELNRRLGIDE